jgi:hypothetical protein
VILLNTPIQSVAVRDVEGSEWNSKKGGWGFGVIPVPDSKVVVGAIKDGVIEMTVPSKDVAVVRAALEAKGSTYTA